MAGNEPEAPVAVTRLFTEALNARDLAALRALVSDDAEFPTPQGRALRGHEGLASMVEAASRTDLLLARTGVEDVGDGTGFARVTVPVRELLSKSEQHGSAVFEVRGGRIAEFEVISST
jgi:ketosteroid isomerase-like protein